MNKRNLIIGIVVLTALVGGVILWNQKNDKQNTDQLKQQTKKEVTKQTQEQKTAQKQETTKEQINTQNQAIDGELKPEEKIDTTNWKTYRNEELGFEVKYPKGWKAREYKSSTILPGLSPIDCKKMPDKCPFTKIRFYNNGNLSKKLLGKIAYFNIQIIPNNEINNYKEGIEISKMQDMITGCLITNITKKMRGKVFLIDTFYEFTDAQQCSDSSIIKVFSKIAETINVL